MRLDFKSVYESGMPLLEWQLQAFIYNLFLPWVKPAFTPLIVVTGTQRFSRFFGCFRLQPKLGIPLYLYRLNRSHKRSIGIGGGG